ncbi:ATP-dependent helicase C-terminal domain-containing protein, partial [Ameyamaea chiangmaiensis]
TALDRPDLPDPTALAPLLAPWLAGLTRLADVRALDMREVLHAALDHQTRVWLDRALPSHIDLPGGRTAVDYTTPTPTLAARAQAFYGLKDTPRLADGRVPLQLALLSPAGRPQAITADLAGFWQGGWSDMRRDMRGRYPKHEWPENPAAAVASTRRSNR